MHNACVTRTPFTTEIKSNRSKIDVRCVHDDGLRKRQRPRLLPPSPSLAPNARSASRSPPRVMESSPPIGSSDSVRRHDQTDRHDPQPSHYIQAHHPHILKMTETTLAHVSTFLSACNADLWLMVTRSRWIKCCKCSCPNILEN